MCTIPLISYKILEKEKYTWYTIAHLTVFIHAFCHRLVENVLKGAESLPRNVCDPMCTHQHMHRLI